MSPLIILKSILAVGNIILLLVLLFIYVRNYRRIKSKFTLGLIIFALLLLTQAFFSHPLVPAIRGHHWPEMGVFTVLPDLFEFVALIALLYISTK
jgi:hypothetical protein